MGFINNIIDFLNQYEFLNNGGIDYAVAALIFIGVILFLKFSDVFIIAILKKASRKTKNTLDDLVVDFLASINWPFFVYVALYLSLKSLSLPMNWPVLLSLALDYLLVIFIVFYASKGIIAVIDHLVKGEVNKRKKKGEGENSSMILVFGTIMKIAIWAVALLMILANFGVEITPLIAGLGVGGIAIALALQPVLSDLFAAFAMYFDKPFAEGDFIKIGNDIGTIQRIGIKTTRITTLQGEELIVSNSELTNTRINNFKKMSERRIVFKFGVEYSTPSKKLKKINDIVTKILKETRNVRLDRVHFHEFGDFSMNFEVVYYVNNNDYTRYMDAQQEINLKLKQVFDKEKIAFAFPTQTIFLEK
jgi:small-conductance mechanosensitive channel